MPSKDLKRAVVLLVSAVKVLLTNCNLFFFITMTLSEAALKKLSKKDFEKLGSELVVSKHVTGMLKERVINMER